MDAFTFSMSSIDLSSATSRALISSHVTGRIVDRAVYVSQLSSVATAITQFAFSQLSFSTLDREDQVCPSYQK
jgi:hypothetical protein